MCIDDCVNGYTNIYYDVLCSAVGKMGGVEDASYTKDEKRYLDEPLSSKTFKELGRLVREEYE